MHSRESSTGASAAVDVIGGGLAGSEAALTLAHAGVPVVLWEMRPANTTPAHHTAGLAELVCSNSFKSEDVTSATGQLKRELDVLGSSLLAHARESRVPAGAALAVDREAFSSAVTKAVAAHELITLRRQEASALPEGRCIVATGPLTSPSFETVLSHLVGDERLAFFDAAAPIIAADSIDRERVFAASRYDKGGSDYLNAPLDREQYERFVSALVSARRVTAKDFESSDLFQACQPIEEIARRGQDAIRFGALKPVGLTDPTTGTRPWAVVQLRPENKAATAYNLVGFQTNLTFGEQARVFRMIPGLEDAEFLRYGVMHRNTFIDSPRVLDATLAVRSEPDVRVSGQLAGTEGYLEAIATGLIAALNTLAEIQGLPRIVLPRTTALGSLIDYATDPGTVAYQPMHVNWGLVPPLEVRVRGRRARYAAYSDRAQHDLLSYVDAHPLLMTRRARGLIDDAD